MNYSDQINEMGFAVVPNLLDRLELDSFLSSIQNIPMDSDSRYAARDILGKIPEVSKLLREDKTRSLLSPLLGSGYFAVRGLFFNKIPAANWRVAWHQDLTIALHRKIETAGFGPWSIKAGIVHAQAPNWLLENMLALRLHLDDCDETNGPLKVIPGSHRSRRLKQDEIPVWIEKTKIVTCLVPKGGALLMRPLLLHSSSPAFKPSNRRVIHIELAIDDLPDGLKWFEKIS
jgi:hypothetical protein